MVCTPLVVPLFQLLVAWRGKGVYSAYPTAQGARHPSTPLVQGHDSTASVTQLTDDTPTHVPVSLVLVFLVAYMTLGALMFSLWEGWSFFEALYFVFVSMSTIGFGDYVPKQPMFMMVTFIYLLFGLALTSMCINVIQEKLSATFQKARAHIGISLGLGDGTRVMKAYIAAPQTFPPPVTGNDIKDDDAVGVSHEPSSQLERSEGSTRYQRGVSFVS